MAKMVRMKSMLARLPTLCAIFLALIPVAVQAESIAIMDNSSNVLLELPGITLPADSNTLIGALGYANDGKLLLSASISNKDGRVSVKLWDTSNWHLIRAMDVDKDQKMAISRDGRWLATSDPEKIASGNQQKEHPRLIRIWDMASGTLAHSLSGHADGIISLIFSQDETKLVSCSHDDTLRIWDVATERQLFKIPIIYGRHLTLMPDGHQLIVETDWTQNLALKLIDIPAGKIIRTLPLPTNGMVASLSVSPDGARVAVAGTDPYQVELLEVAAGHKLPPVGQSKIGVENVIFSPDGNHLFIDNWGGTPAQDNTQYRQIEIWDGNGATLQRTIRRTGPREDGGTFSLSPDSRQLAYGTEKGVVELWDVREGSQQASLDAAVTYIEVEPANRADEIESLRFYQQGEEYYKATPPNYEEALKSYQLAAENGHAYAAYRLGFMYRDGKGTPQDIQQTIKWSRFAVEHGYAPAQSSLVYGYTVVNQYEQALMWAYIASTDSAQNEYAKKNIAGLEKRLTGAAIDDVQKLARKCTARNYRGC